MCSLVVFVDQIDMSTMSGKGLREPIIKYKNRCKHLTRSPSP